MTGLELREVTKHYDAGELVRAVDGVSLQVVSGEIVGLCGPSGSGKSTLLRMAARRCSTAATSAASPCASGRCCCAARSG